MSLRKPPPRGPRPGDRLAGDLGGLQGRKLRLPHAHRGRQRVGSGCRDRFSPLLVLQTRRLPRAPGAPSRGLSHWAGSHPSARDLVRSHQSLLEQRSRRRPPAMDIGTAGQEGPGGPWEDTPNHNIANVCALESPELNGEPRIPTSLHLTSQGQHCQVWTQVGTLSHHYLAGPCHLPALCRKTLFIVLNAPPQSLASAAQEESF